MRISITALVVLLVLASGCTTSSPTSDGDSIEDAPRGLDEINPGNESADVAPGGGVPFHNVTQMEACRGWMFEAAVPSHANPGNPPGDWPPADDRFTLLRYMGAVCEVASSGYLETGPFSFVVELHDNMEAPPQCHAPGAFSFTLTHLGVSSEMNSTSLWMQEVPMESGQFDVEPDLGGTGEAFSWSMNRGTGAVRYIPEDAGGIGTDPIRAFYTATGGIAAVSISLEASSSEPGAAPAILETTGAYLAAQLADELPGAISHYEIERIKIEPLDLEAIDCA